MRYNAGIEWWLNIGINVTVLVGLALLWRLKIPTRRRLPWLVWAPDVVLAGWGVYALWTGRWGNAIVAAIVLLIWFALTYPLWRTRHEVDPHVGGHS